MSHDDQDKPLHVYDGIEEQDNRLPNWWLGILFGTLAFGFGYWFYYEIAGAAPGPAEQLKVDLAELAKRNPESLPMSDDVLLALAKDSDKVKAGQEVYATTCAACHGADGQGVIGPNLTDRFWLHGGKATDIHHVVAAGVLEKGRPSWDKTLGAERVRNVTAYLLTLKGKNIPGGKAPQGDPVE